MVHTLIRHENGVFYKPKDFKLKTSAFPFRVDAENIL